MLWVWGLLFILFVLCLWVMISFIKIQISLKRIHKDDRFSVDVYLFRRLFHYQYEISLVEFRNAFDGVELKSKSSKKLAKSDSDGESLITPKNIWDYLKDARELVTHFIGFSKWLSQSMTYIHCTHLKWKTSVGIGGAPETAMLTGIIWGVNSNIISYFINKIKMNVRPELEVHPLYNKIDIYIDAECILKIRIAHAIYIAIHFMIRLLKAKGGFKTWKSILSKG
ncbi:DUF2953 domain-containing protein [Chengkuizengella marina]|uniref:DUF2953 domain-containing protein n=1 Tax=Chengkuizengella marina TaxID=2507566 RepID=A0A6N9Q720_9BACL|nr:DUF2953 domain-containing protein [Chengkuizengella marina]NBI30424.1 DUF2953 domain-containing protein [Chengkuizengella marina]